MSAEISKIKPNLSDDKLDDELHRIKREFDRKTAKENTQLLDELNKGVISSDEYIQKFGLQIEKINSANGAALAEYGCLIRAFETLVNMRTNDMLYLAVAPEITM